MERIITVKATGHVSVAPDMIEISINLNSHDFNYEKAIELSNNKIDSLTSALKEIGFSEGLIKTSYFSVNTDYRCDDDNTCIFNGYICNHDLMLRFDLDLHVLSQTIVAISKSLTNPNFSIDFTIKDKEVISRQLLKDATKKAKERAQALCEASNVKLGNLLNINYNWGEIDVYSDTRFSARSCLEKLASINPQEIEIEDSVSFIWEIT